MKRTLILIACVAICCAMMAACKNAKTAGPTSDEIQAQKVALADSVLAGIDTLAQKYIDASSYGFRMRCFELTDAEKMVKPDFLLDPSFAETLVTKSQKISALAIYCVEQGIRKIYDMPLEEVKEVIVKLAAELNHPVDMKLWLSDAPASEKVKREYESFKERGDLAFFWLYHNAIIVEYFYLFAQNPDFFFSKISDEQWSAFTDKIESGTNALSILALYYEDAAHIHKINNKNRITVSDEEMDLVLQSKESAKQFSVENKDKFIAHRNALLQ